MLDKLFEKINEFLELRNQRRIALRQCRNCEILSNLLENERRERVKLFNLMDKDLNKQESIDEREYNPLNKSIPWSIRRQQLEKESRERNAK